jgi:hypothetical protein
MSGVAPEAEDVPMVPVAAVSEEPPAAPMAPPAPEVFLAPEAPEQQTGLVVGGSTAMDVETEESPSAALADEKARKLLVFLGFVEEDVVMDPAPAEVEDAPPDVPASSSHAAVHLAELIQGAETDVPALGPAYFSDAELGLNKTRGVRHDLKPGRDSLWVDLLQRGHHDEAYFHLLFHYGVCELCYSTVEAHIVLTPIVQTNEICRCSCGGDFLSLFKADLKTIDMPRVFVGDCQDCGYFHTAASVRRCRRACSVYGPLDLPMWPDSDDSRLRPDDQVRFAVVSLRAPDDTLRTLEDLNANNLRRYAEMTGRAVEPPPDKSFVSGSTAADAHHVPYWFVCPDKLA